MKPRHWMDAAWRYAGLSAVALLTTGPFLWLLATSLKGANEAVMGPQASLWPQQPTLEHYAAVMATQPFALYLFNSVIVAAMAVLANVTLSSLAAYPLARMDFAGRRWVFGVLLATMMVPIQLLMIPLYELAVALGLRNSALGLVLPHACTAFGIFFMRQAFLSVPRALEEVALVEGVSRLRIWWHVMLPMVRPALATLAIFTFVGAWGDFLWPLVLMDEPSRYTLPLGVNRLAGTFSMDWRLVAAGAVFSILPILAVYAVGQRWLIAGVMKGAVKG